MSKDQRNSNSADQPSTSTNRYADQSDGSRDQKVDELIQSYEYIIKIYIKKFQLMRDYEDVMQEGRIAIFKAIQSFQKNQGANLVTYISVCVKRRLLSYVRNQQTKKETVYRNRISYESIEGVSTNGNHFNLEESVISKIHIEKSIEKAKMNIRPLELEIYNRYNYGYSIAELSEIYNIPRKKLYVIIGAVLGTKSVVK